MCGEAACSAWVDIAGGRWRSSMYKSRMRSSRPYLRGWIFIQGPGPSMALLKYHSINRKALGRNSGGRKLRETRKCGCHGKRPQKNLRCALFSETAAAEFRKRDCGSPGPVIQRVESALRPSNCLAIWPWWTRGRGIFTQKPKADYYVDVLLSLEPITKGGGHTSHIFRVRYGYSGV